MPLYGGQNPKSSTGKAVSHLRHPSFAIDPWLDQEAKVGYLRFVAEEERC